MHCLCFLCSCCDVLFLLCDVLSCAVLCCAFCVRLTVSRLCRASYVVPFVLVCAVVCCVHCCGVTLGGFLPGEGGTQGTRANYCINSIRNWGEGERLSQKKHFLKRKHERLQKNTGQASLKAEWPGHSAGE